MDIVFRESRHAIVTEHINAALVALQAVGAHMLLTDAEMHLLDAQRKVKDHAAMIDAPPPVGTPGTRSYGRYPPATLTIDQHFSGAEIAYIHPAMDCCQKCGGGNDRPCSCPASSPAAPAVKP